MLNFLMVGIGGGLGAMLRHAVGIGAVRVFGHGFPSGTMFVNIVGSFAMGILIAWLAQRTSGAGTEIRLFLATGILGGFTTFSAFSLDAVSMYERGDVGLMLAYIAVSVAGSVLALFAALWIVRALT